MNARHLNDISVFVEVARAQGFRAAATNLNIAAGSVSEAIQRIESKLGIRLFERTTRKIALTNAGEKLYQRTLPAITDVERALTDIKEEENAISGTLSLTAPRSSASFFLDEILAKFANLYPDTPIEVMYDDNKVDLVTSGVDAAIRSQTLIEKDTHAVEIGPKLDMALVASPTYLERNGTPETPNDIADHNGICFAFENTKKLAPWTFINEDSTPYSIMPNKRVVVNDLTSLVNLARSGIGLTYLYRKVAEPYINSGELTSLFDDKIPVLPRYTINYLTKHHMPSRLRAFIDLAKTMT
ncbi:LysR family transcriptional regulator [Alteromonadaceae bacterium M269]|nr:LysR family transcriptional regulator [Alteromonadaceae bacterium M269]